ncbi:MAG: hypothetical protein COV69_03955 [Parcubacteria group bacterium CG11_big_fil_rev_8_21_14_0_20_39_14]|nr:MAG: hypothetical protein COV69_03955 [Parcubacteria group bacterium CG11_big_fil_rev_8_21_14_0_20_39_14]PIS35752.1 MAG: hypothetical protein COT36_00800 [Parcubacteria group bacterium CG08_land_8_20_14_0_20_38_56]
MLEEKDEKTQRQIKILIDLIFAKGLSHTLKVAEHLDNPFILGEFYRNLTGDIYNELVKRKKLKSL